MFYSWWPTSTDQWLSQCLSWHVCLLTCDHPVGSTTVTSNHHVRPKKRQGKKVLQTVLGNKSFFFWKSNWNPVRIHYLFHSELLTHKRKAFSAEKGKTPLSPISFLFVKSFLSFREKKITEFWLLFNRKTTDYYSVQKPQLAIQSKNLNEQKSDSYWEGVCVCGRVRWLSLSDHHHYRCFTLTVHRKMCGFKLEVTFLRDNLMTHTLSVSQYFVFDRSMERDTSV